MNFFDKIKYVLSYDIGYEFYVFDFSAQQFVQFIKFEDAKAFSDSQIMYKPKIYVSVRKRK